jgi:hypothetical protein
LLASRCLPLPPLCSTAHAPTVLSPLPAQWTVALEWTGSPSVAPCSALVGSRPAELLPEPVAAAVAAAVRGDSACPAAAAASRPRAQAAEGAVAQSARSAEAGSPGGSGPESPAGSGPREVEWELLFLESYRESTRVDVRKLSALMQLTLLPAAA